MASDAHRHGVATAEGSSEPHELALLRRAACEVGHLTILLIAVLLSGCTCRVQTHAERKAEVDEYHAAVVEGWRSHITVVPYPDAGVLCFIHEGTGYGPSLSCVPTGGAR